MGKCTLIFGGKTDESDMEATEVDEVVEDSLNLTQPHKTG